MRICDVGTTLTTVRTAFVESVVTKNLLCFFLCYNSKDTNTAAMWYPHLDFSFVITDELRM
jgi:hypothetical protein